MRNMLIALIKRQIIVTLIAAALMAVFFGMNGAISATCGGFAVVLGSLAASLKLRKIWHVADKTATGALGSLLMAEVIKIVIIAITLLIVFKVYKQLVPMALIAGLAASAILSGASVLAIDKTGLENN